MKMVVKCIAGVDIKGFGNDIWVGKCFDSDDQCSG